MTMRLEDREMVCKRLSDAGADLVLSGHVHEWFVSPKVQDKAPNHFTIGTGAQQCSKRSFAVIDIFEDLIKIIVFEFDEKCKQFTTNGKAFGLVINLFQPRRSGA